MQIIPEQQWTTKPLHLIEFHCLFYTDNMQYNLCATYVLIIWKSIIKSTLERDIQAYRYTDNIKTFWLHNIQKRIVRKSVKIFLLPFFSNIANLCAIIGKTERGFLIATVLTLENPFRFNFTFKLNVL